MTALLTIILILQGCAWSTRDKILAGLSTAATITDTYTSVRMLKNPDNYERNWMEGSHPSDADLIIYMGSMQLLTLAIAGLFPKARPYILGGKAALNTVCTINNTKLDWSKNGKH